MLPVQAFFPVCVLNFKMNTWHSGIDVDMFLAWQRSCGRHHQALGIYAKSSVASFKFQRLEDELGVDPLLTKEHCKYKLLLVCA
jgi:hypothetical protein